ncbi:MAG: exodeoxyribonuclease VII large subunit [Spirochaetales bacterium]|nr:exodeoxyribonuclease VII large subunit [Spirochaetales bacterium]
MNPIWTVSELTEAIKNQLQGHFPRIMVTGEVTNCRPSGAGHVYFTLKDQGALLPAALFRGRRATCSVQPADGLQVIATGKIDVYPPRGAYQLIVDQVRPAGRGALLEELEARKNALAAEGLFRQDQKKKLPPYPHRVAIITSPTGAAVQDILRVLSRRAAAPQITILPCPVQGSDAAERIAHQITSVGRYALGEVAIVARGGGSLEDLMCFNDERVVRAIAGCSIPIVSGVGHETDTTLTDLAADIRAATPSAAAELVSEKSEDLLGKAQNFQRETADILHSRLREAWGRWDARNPIQLERSIREHLEWAIRREDEARMVMNQEMINRKESARHRLTLALQGLHDASPKALMERGYARVSHNGHTICDASELHPQSEILLEFAQGRAKALVTEIETETVLNREEI